MQRILDTFEKVFSEKKKKIPSWHLGASLPASVLPLSAESAFFLVGTMMNFTKIEQRKFVSCDHTDITRLNQRMTYASAASKSLVGPHSKPSKVEHIDIIRFQAKGQIIY